MTAPGLSVEQVFKQVRKGVITETEGKQTPGEYSSLVGEFAFVPAQADRVPPGGPPSPSAASNPEPGQVPQQRPPAAGVPAAPLPEPATPPRATGLPPSPSTSVPPQQPTERAVPANASSGNTPHEEAERNNPKPITNTPWKSTTTHN